MGRRCNRGDQRVQPGSQTLDTWALRTAMTSAEFQRRDASRARGPKVSTGVLAQLRSARWRIKRERRRVGGRKGTEARRVAEEG